MRLGRPSVTSGGDSEDGFTLIEILVSLAILGMILPTILLAFSNSSRTRAASEARTTAAYLVRDKLSELQAQGAPQPGEEEGSFGEGSRFRWATSISQTETEGLYDVVVRVIWLERGQEREFDVHTFLADPSMQQGQTTGAAPGGR